MTAVEWILTSAFFVLVVGGATALSIRYGRRERAARRAAYERLRVPFTEVAARLGLALSVPEPWTESYLMRASGERRDRAIAIEVTDVGWLGADSPTVLVRSVVLVGPAGEPAPTSAGFGSGVAPHVKWQWGGFFERLDDVSMEPRTRAALESVAPRTAMLELDGRWLRLAPICEHEERIAGGGTRYFVPSDPNELVRWIDETLDLYDTLDADPRLPRG